MLQPEAKDVTGGRFPKKVMWKANRSFHDDWYYKKLSSGELVLRQWLSYSIKKDVMLCIPCFLFAGETDTSGSGKGRFSKEWSETGLSDWKDSINKINRHEMSEAHLFCGERFNYFKQGKGIDQMLDEQRAKAAKEREIKIKNNRAILRRLISRGTG